jgi:hypothetical protein
MYKASTAGGPSAHAGAGAQPSGGNGASPGSKDTVVDAEFVDVDESEKKK